MSKWPILISESVPESELPEGITYATRDVEVIPADLGRALKLALVNMFEDGDEMDRATAAIVIERYEREVGK